MSIREQGLNNQPKFVFVNSLILFNNQIENMLYFTKTDSMQLISCLQGLINMLDAQSKKNINPITEELTSYSNNTKLLRSQKQLQQVHSKILNYLHDTYFREYGFASPKYGKTVLTLPEGANEQ